MLPTPASIAAPPSAKSRPSCRPAVPPPPVDGGAAGTAGIVGDGACVAGAGGAGDRVGGCAVGDAAGGCVEGWVVGAWVVDGWVGGWLEGPPAGAVLAVGAGT